MKRDKATYLLKELYVELHKEYPDLRYSTYRDGGSISFSVPTEGYNNIVLLAPVVSNRVDGNRIEFTITHADILKEGCTRFEDSYTKENVLGSVSFDGLRQPSEKDIKKRIRELLKKRL